MPVVTPKYYFIDIPASVLFLSSSNGANIVGFNCPLCMTLFWHYYKLTLVCKLKVAKLAISLVEINKIDMMAQMMGQEDNNVEMEILFQRKGSISILINWNRKGKEPPKVDHLFVWPNL